MDKVHDAHTVAGIVADLRLWRNERLRDGVNDRAQVCQGRLRMAGEQLFSLMHVVLTILLQKTWGDVLDHVLVLLFPVMGVTA